MDHIGENPRFHADDSITCLQLKPARKHFDVVLKRLDLARRDSKRTAHLRHTFHASIRMMKSLPGQLHGMNPAPAFCGTRADHADHGRNRRRICQMRDQSTPETRCGSPYPSELSRWQQRLKEDYRKECNELLRSAFQSYPGTPDLPSLKNCCHALILGYVVALPEIDAQIDALVLRRQISARMDCPYIPIRFVRSESISMFDKLLLAFDAVAFSKAYGKMPRLGRIIHGRDHRTAAVPLPRPVRRINSVLKALTEQRARNVSPPLALNKHCVECEFQSRCREIAVAKDDRSLLPTLSSKERKKQNDKGIFTVLQLS